MRTIQASQTTSPTICPPLLLGTAADSDDVASTTSLTTPFEELVTVADVKVHEQEQIFGPLDLPDIAFDASSLLADSLFSNFLLSPCLNPSPSAIDEEKETTSDSSESSVRRCTSPMVWTQHSHGRERHSCQILDLDFVF